MTTPIERITRLLDEGASFVACLPGNIIIDVTPDITTAMTEVQIQRDVTCDGLTCLPDHESSHKPG